MPDTPLLRVLVALVITVLSTGSVAAGLASTGSDEPATNSPDHGAPSAVVATPDSFAAEVASAVAPAVAPASTAVVDQAAPTVPALVDAIPVVGTAPPSAPDDDDDADATPASAAAPVPRCATGATRSIAVDTTDELKTAVANAQPGDAILLADGQYLGPIRPTRSGSVDLPIRLCGSRAAVLKGGTIRSGEVIGLRASHWELSGFTVTYALKGIKLQNADFNVLDNLEVHTTGYEAIHLAEGSTDNVVRGSVIHHTGRRDPRFGEGVYVGTAESNRCDLFGCRPDPSDRNQVVGNRFFEIRAEAVDVKEGTRAGLVENNDFDGAASTARSFVDVKGNGWVVRHNRGVSAPEHGFITETAGDGWGTANAFIGNVVEGPLSGFGFFVTKGNTVACDNQAPGAARGLANVACVPAE